MPSSFRPKFADLVRNFTSTSGTGNIVLGAAVAGHSSLAASVAVGEQFFYCMQGIDRPAEREVGRGTMAANGTIVRAPIGAAPTNFGGGIKTIALVVAADWFAGVGDWINGGADSLAGLATANKTSLVAALNEVAASSGGGGGTIGSTMTFASAAGAAIPATTLALATAGYATVGRGAARYVYDGAVNATFVAANPRTAFLTAGGRGFRLDPQQRLTLEMFGGRADYAGLGNVGTDNLPALMAAAQFKPDATRTFAPTIHLGIGSYYFSATAEPRNVFHLKGEGTGYFAGGNVGAVATRFVTPINTTCLRIASRGTQGLGFSASLPEGAAGSTIEGICFEQATMGADLTAHGIHARGAPIIRNCQFDNIAGNCIEIGATAGSLGATEGNCNDWRVENVFCHSSGGDGLHVWGADANAGVSTGVQTSYGVLGCGIRDTAYFVNTHIGAQITGYGNGGVQYGGRKYQGIALDPALLGSTVPGASLAVWYDLGALAAPNASFPAWVNGGSYRTTAPLIASGPAVFVGTYIEGGGLYGAAHAPLGTVIGNNMGWTDQTPVLETNAQMGVISQRGIGHYRSTRGQTDHPAFGAIGAEEFTAIGTVDPDAPGDSTKRSTILWHRVASRDWVWRYVNSDMVAAYYGGGATSFSISGYGTTRTYGRNAVQPGVFSLHDPALIDATDSNNARIIGIRAAAPTTGYHARGEFYFNVNPSATGTLGWTCTTAGTPGTFTPVPIGFSGNLVGTLNVGNGSQQVDLFANGGDGTVYMRAMSATATAIPLTVMGSTVTFNHDFGATSFSADSGGLTWPRARACASTARRWWARGARRWPMRPTRRARSRSSTLCWRDAGRTG